jgi:RHS repeat-associated protein
MKSALQAINSFVYISLLCILSLPAQAALVGSTPGGFAVGQSGAANYSIPIQVPPGIADMAPQLSLDYSSHSGNGLLGLGWHLSGLSSITRCPATKAQDGFIDGVDFDSNDRYCLDGQRLMQTGTGSDSNGSYTEYRTEINTFSRIRSYGTAGSGPASFRVWTPSGQQMEYGVTPDSSIEAQGRTDVLVWALNKMMDTSKNYMTISYTENNANGEFRPNRVDYTGNANVSPSVTPYASVQFSYTSRTDNITHYIGGSLNKTTQRLTNVKTYVGNALVKDYRLAYGIYGAANLSRLLSVTECDGQVTPQCLPPTEFDWKAETTGFNSSNPFALPTVINDYDAYSTGYRQGELIDVNGDGLADWVRAYRNHAGTDYIRTWLNTGSGWDDAPGYYLPTPIMSYEAYSTGIRQGELVDVNGDGLVDWVRAYRNQAGTSYIKTWLNTGTGWADGTNYNLPTVIHDYAAASTGYRWGEFADVNGDGLVDWVRAYRNHAGTDYIKTWLNTGSGWTDGTNYNLPTVIMTYEAYSTGIRQGELVDVNGDGLVDWVRAYRNQAGTSYIKTWLNTGTGWADGTNYNLPTVINDYAAATSGYVQGEFADVNGDGLVDWVRAYRNHAGTDYIKTWLNTGGGWTDGTNYNLPTVIMTYEAYSTGIRQGELVDVNGDGLVDWVRAYRNQAGTSYIKTWLNTGAGWADGTNYNLPTVIHDYAAASTGYRWGEFADVNGDGLVDWVRAYKNHAGSQYIGTWLARSNAPGSIQKITDGLGAKTELTYKYLTDSTVYTKGTGASYPVRDIREAIPVVSQVNADNGLGGTIATDYFYAGMRAHLHGRGGLGFASMKVTDGSSGIKATTEYRQDFPFTGMPSHSETRLSSNQLLSKSDMTYAYTGTIGSGPVFPHLTGSVQINYDLNNSLLVLSQVTTGYSNYDSYGNVGNVTVTTVGNSQTFTTVTANTYNNDPANWFLGQLLHSSVTKTIPGPLSSTRRSAFAYHSTTGLLTKEIIEPNPSNHYGAAGVNANITLTTAYEYDAFGNRIKTILCPGNIAPNNCISSSTGARVTTLSYASNHASYPNGLFATTSTNAESHSETRVYDVKFGGITSLTGPNGLTTTWAYDSLGRSTTETRADNTQTSISRAWCASGCASIGGATVKYSVTTTRTGASASVAYFDKLGRELRNQITGFDGTLVYSDIHYDSQGRVLKTSTPYFSGGDPLWTTPGYDVLGREIQLTFPRGDGTYLSTRVQYNGFTTIYTDAKNRNRSEVRNALGQVISVTDALNNTMTHAYDAQGNLTKTTDSGNNQIVLQYDLRSRKISMNDPDMGAWTYAYNAFGELVSQTDAKGQVTTMQYDKLGRMTQRVDDATGSPQTSTFTFGTSAANKNIGKLASMSGPSGTSQSYLYDSLGRSSQTTYNIDTDSFVVQQSYDSAGRPDITTYPVTTKYPSGFKVRRIYNTRGYLEKVQTTDTTPFVFWQATAMSAQGQVVADTLGNGIDTIRAYNPANGFLESTQAVNSSFNVVYDTEYTYDEVGNLLTRTDLRPNPDIVETFTYDNLDRLLTSQITGQSQKTYAYNALGNITSKSGVGTYSYTGCGGRPHAVCSAGGNSYSYDANGNMLSGAGRTVNYTAFNLPYQFFQGGTTVSFVYGADRNRVLKVSGNIRIRYVGMSGTGNPLFEQEYNSSTGNRKNIHYIYADGSQAVAQHIAEGGSATTEYFHRDHLGSIEAISAANGLLTSVVYLNYDAWGQRITGPNIRSGFTGHETITEVGLVHMNGRVYDPVLGRFLSADPIIQMPGNMQSYNRYSYVLNNPLSYTDPSGYSLKKRLKKRWNKLRKSAREWDDKLEKYASTIASVGFSMMGMPFVGSIISGAIGIANGGSFRDFVAGVGMGVIAGAITGPVSGYLSRSLGLSARHLGTALLRGGLAGGTSGALNAMYHGTSISEGFRNGVLSGVATSAIVWGYRDYKTGQFIKNNVNCGSSGCTQDQINAIKDAGQSPIGQKLMGQFRSGSSILNLFPEYSSPAGLGLGPHVITGTNDMYFDGNFQGSNLYGLISGETWGPTMDDGAVFVHELNHTLSAANMNDPLNVAYSENLYRAWMGAPMRNDYNILSMGQSSLPVPQRSLVDQVIFTWR